MVDPGHHIKIFSCTEAVVEGDV